MLRGMLKGWINWWSLGVSVLEKASEEERHSGQRDADAEDFQLLDRAWEYEPWGCSEMI